jgi:hypothetical protein
MLLVDWPLYGAIITAVLIIPSLVCASGADTSDEELDDPLAAKLALQRNGFSRNTVGPSIGAGSRRDPRTERLGGRARFKTEFEKLFALRSSCGKTSARLLFFLLACAGFARNAHDPCLAPASALCCTQAVQQSLHVSMGHLSAA